jgi:hypothetical protein
MRPSLVAGAVCAALFAAPTAAGATTVLRLHGIGPLTLGMTRTDAVKTGWLANRGKGCPLGGTPVPITYRFTGSQAPSGIAGTAEFRGGRLRGLSFTHGVRAAAGVTVGKTRIVRMWERYRALGFSATGRYDNTFQGTFVTVKRHGRTVIGGFARGNTVSIIGIPDAPVCE